VGAGGRLSGRGRVQGADREGEDACRQGRDPLAAPLVPLGGGQRHQRADAPGEAELLLLVGRALIERGDDGHAADLDRGHRGRTPEGVDEVGALISPPVPQVGRAGCDGRLYVGGEGPVIVDHDGPRAPRSIGELTDRASREMGGVRHGVGAEMDQHGDLTVCALTLTRGLLDEARADWCPGDRGTCGGSDFPRSRIYMVCDGDAGELGSTGGAPLMDASATIAGSPFHWPALRRASPHCSRRAAHSPGRCLTARHRGRCASGGCPADRCTHWSR
jgi:hypothetical protein